MPPDCKSELGLDRLTLVWAFDFHLLFALENFKNISGIEGMNSDLDVLENLKEYKRLNIPLFEFLEMESLGL